MFIVFFLFLYLFLKFDLILNAVGLHLSLDAKRVHIYPVSFILVIKRGGSFDTFA